MGKENFHIPPDNEYSTIYLDIMAIPVRKDFPYMREFNELYVFFICLKYEIYLKCLIRFLLIRLKFILNNESNSVETVIYTFNSAN